jgi:hypothetical protein
MRLIDADKAVEQIKEWLNQTRAIPLDTSYYFELLGCIEDCPTIDVVPVVRGWWRTWEEQFPDRTIRKKNNLGVFCSACQLHADNMTSYCPNCGAKMGEKRNTMKLIDADKLKTELDAWARIIQNPDHYMRADALHIIDTAPEIDAVPVVRGEWKLYGNDDDSSMSYWCTVCNFQLSEDLFYSGYENGRWIKNRVFKYCPNCGAEMEVEP